MAGQLIRLPGVTAAAAAGAPRITMTPADAVAARIGSLLHVVSARRMTNRPEGGVNARCGLTGQELVGSGANANRIQVVERAGQKGLYMGPAASGGQGAAASLKLPEGSLKNSYSIALVVYFDTLDKAGNYITNLVTGWTGETYVYSPLRAYGLQYSSSRAGQLYAGSDSGLAISVPTPASNQWAVIFVDHNAETGMLNLSINQAGGQQSLALPSSMSSMQPNSRLDLGYATTNNSLRNSCIAECYVFSQSLLSTSQSLTQAQELVTQLKTQYGIA